MSSEPHPQKRVSVRLSARTHAIIKREAELEDMGITQYTREAVIARAFIAIGKRNDELPARYHDLVIAARNLYAAEGLHDQPDADD